MPASYEQEISLAGDLHARPAGALAVTARHRTPNQAKRLIA